MFFFDPDDINYGGRIKRKPPPAAIDLSCDTCGLVDLAESPMLKTYGYGDSGVMFILPWPNSREMLYERPLTGTGGKMLKEIVEDAGLNFWDDCSVVYAQACPPDDDKGDQLYQACCRERLWRRIQKEKPSVIIPLGYWALASLINHRAGDTQVGGSIDRWRGATIPDRELGCWVCPAELPTWVYEKSERNPAVLLYWIQDITNAIKLKNTKIPYFVDERQQVEILQKPQDVALVLRDAMRCRGLVAFDYETTGLKPHAVGHEIYTVSISYEDDRAFAWRHMRATTDPWLDFLESDVKKVAANKKFEEMWSRVILKTRVNNWVWDTMLAAHVLDNRRGVTGLKFQMLTKFGLFDYDSHISAYLEGEQKGNANSFNRIKQAPLEDILIYNGVDSLGERRLAVVQMPMVREQGLMPAYLEYMHDGADTFADMEERGIPTDANHINVQRRILEKEVADIQDSLFSSEIGRAWRRKFGKDTNINSDAQVIWALERDGVELTKRTAKGNTALDKEVLEQLAHPLAETVLRVRKVSKAAGTFLAGIRRETVNGLCHPFFNLHNVVTFRSSSDSPNFQNFPKRDQEMQRIVRNAFKAPKDSLFIEIDYSGVEVRISYCYHKDPQMREYLLNPETDMHRDMACQIYLIDHDDFRAASKDEHMKREMKTLRNAGKTGWVFPSFYGATYKSCAQNLWLYMSLWGLKAPDGRPLQDHLRSQGIKKFEHFEGYLQEVYDDFWGSRFKVYQDWKETIWEEYCSRGYIETFTGFRIGGVMDFTNVINAQAQGTAFHCLLWSLNRLNKELVENKYRTQALGQIHDAIFLLGVQDELKDVYNISRRVMIDDLCKAHRWITIPMDVDMDISPVGGTWGEQTSYKPE